MKTCTFLCFQVNMKAQKHACLHVKFPPPPLHHIGKGSIFCCVHTVLTPQLMIMQPFSTKLSYATVSKDMAVRDFGGIFATPLHPQNVHLKLF